MTIPLLIALAVVVLIGVVLDVRRVIANAGRGFDAGAVSTRWLAELRRDEPWTPS